MGGRQKAAVSEGGMTPKQVEKFAVYSWNEIIASVSVAEELKPEEKTSAMFAKETGLSVSRASNVLLRLYRENKLTRRKMRNHGWAYAPKKG